MNLDDYRAHLDYLKSKVDSGELWGRRSQRGKLLPTKKLAPNRCLVDAEPLGDPVAIGGGRLARG